MIAKAFQKLNYTSVTVSSLLLVGVSYYYSNLEFKWSLFESRLLNGIIIFGALMLTNYAIDTVTRQLTIERTNRNAYHLLLYPIVVLSFPVETVDMRFILASAATWSAWRNTRLFFEATNNNEKLKRLLDAALLITISSVFILENILVLLIPLILLVIANVKRDIKHFIIIIGTPLILLPTIHIIISFIGLDLLLFSSYIFEAEDQLQISKVESFEIPISFGSLALVIIYFIIALAVKLRKTSGFQRRALDVAGILFFFTVVSFFMLNKVISGSEYHYTSLILVYFIAQIFVKKINSFYINFIFISIIASTIIFRFIL